MNRADVISLACGEWSVGGIAEDDGVDLGWVVRLVAGGRSTRSGAGRAGCVGVEVDVPGVGHGEQDEAERAEGGDDGEQDGAGAEPLAAGEVEVGRVDGGAGLLHAERS